MAATDQLQFFWWAQKPKEYVWSIFFNFNITFLATCGCAIDANKTQKAARGQLQICLWAQRLYNSTSEIIQILQSNSPQYGDVQVIF